MVKKNRSAVLIDINFKFNSFMAAPTVFRNLVSNKCWNDENIFILETHNIGFVTKKNNKFSLDKSFNFSFKQSFKKGFLKRRKIFKYFYYKTINKLQNKFPLINDFVVYKIYKKIIRKNNINYIIKCACKNEGLKPLIKAKKRLGINYSLVTTDPIFYTRSDCYNRKILKLEKKVIDNSDKYFVPEHCFDRYSQFFKNEKILKFCIPSAFEFNEKLAFTFKLNNVSYFGTIADYRVFNSCLEYLCKKQELEVRMYGWIDKNKFGNFKIKYLNPITGNEFIDKLLESTYLLAFDNPKNMTDLLPSKIVSYTSTTKPIIIFGENDDSALLKYLRKIDYKRYIYLKPTDSFELLDKFVKKYSNVDFDEECYKRQSDYYPSNVSQYVYNQIFGK